MDADPAEVIVNEEVFVLEDGANLLGLIVLAPASDHLLVDNVAVEPDLQGRGHGRELLDFAARHARELGFTELRLYTNVAMTENIALYRRLGWHEYDRHDGGGFSRVYFRKALA
jgi:ribosomal protein S18 acetylase RimI-like enzyme